MSYKTLHALFMSRKGVTGNTQFIPLFARLFGTELLYSSLPTQRQGSGYKNEENQKQPEVFCKLCKQGGAGSRGAAAATSDKRDGGGPTGTA